jgi:hypothetical protein
MVWGTFLSSSGHGGVLMYLLVGTVPLAQQDAAGWIAKIYVQAGSNLLHCVQTSSGAH